jgi:hypothetical protein
MDWGRELRGKRGEWTDGMTDEGMWWHKAFSRWGINSIYNYVDFSIFKTPLIIPQILCRL